MTDPLEALKFELEWRVALAGCCFGQYYGTCCVFSRPRRIRALYRAVELARRIDTLEAVV